MSLLFDLVRPPSRGRLWLWAASTLSALASLGCSETSVDGDLGQGTFQYVCLDDGDAACPAVGVVGTKAPSSDQPIAVGGELGLTFTPNDANKPIGVLFPASADRAAITTRGFRALLPGQVAMLVRSSNGILDFTHLTFVTPTKLVVGAPAEAKGTAPLPLGFGAERTIDVFPVDATNQQLAGSFVYTWSSDAPNVVALKDDTQGRRATIAAREAGTAHLQIAAAGVAETLELTIVVASTAPTSPTGAGEQND